MDYYAFGAPMPGRTGNSGDYRYGFNGKEMENELHGNTGDAYDFGARIYNARLGKFLSTDPREGDYPWQSTYVFAANNPIALIDVNGEYAEETVESDKSNRAENKFNRKYDRWWERNQDRYPDLKTRPERENEFLKSRASFGRMVSETKWAKNHLNATWIGSTGWEIDLKRSSKPISTASSSGMAAGSLRKIDDITVQKGTMQINYNLLAVADRLQVINTATGEVLFDTKNLSQADADGKVRRRIGSGQYINFDLGEGNTNITVLINGGVTPPSTTGTTTTSAFRYSISIFPKESFVNNGRVIENSPRKADRKVRSKEIPEEGG